MSYIVNRALVENQVALCNSYLVDLGYPYTVKIVDKAQGKVGLVVTNPGDNPSRHGATLTWSLTKRELSDRLALLNDLFAHIEATERRKENLNER